jgi:hypothetical protein
VGNSPTDFRKFLDEEFKRWNDLAKANNIRAQ